MKNRTVLLLVGIGVVVLIGLKLLLEPREFEWDTTYGHYDDEPYGCELFDSVLSATMGSRYRVTCERLDSLLADSAAAPPGVLLIDQSISEQATMALYRAVERGAHAVIAEDYYFMGRLADTLGIHTNTNRYRGYRNEPVPGQWATIRYDGDQPTYRPHRFRAYQSQCRTVLALDSVTCPHEVLAWVEADEEMEDDMPVAAAFHVGQGELVLVTTPTLLSNYGLLDDGTRVYTMRLLSHLGTGPVVRYDGTLRRGKAQDADLLDFILSQPPLRLAFWLSLAGVVLFMVFTARRRQRVISVVEEPQNRALEFVQLIGSLYYEQGDHADLVAKKHQYASERLRRELRGDTRRADELRHQLDDLLAEARRSAPLSPKEMKYYIDQIDEVMNSI